MDPQLYKGIRIPRVFEGIRARDSSVEETSKLGLGSSPEQGFSKMLVLAMFLKLFRNIARTNGSCVRPVESVHDFQKQMRDHMGILKKVS